MDLAYDQRAERDRRKNRSLTNINHLSLAPLTVRLPLGDGDDFPDIQPPLYGTSYLEGKSAPTTPRLLSRAATPARSRSHQRVPSVPITKSRSSSHLVVGVHARRPTGGSGAATPRRRRDDGLAATARETPDSDWLLRTGAFMSSEAREYKGQAWLVSRQSSTSLTGMRDGGGSDDDEAPREPELARPSRRGSRRGSSSVADDDATPPYGSRFPSRFHSRAHSMTDENRGHVGTPPALYHAGSGNSSGSGGGSEGSYFLEAAGPDFVNLDERLEALEGDTTHEDEAAVRRLVRRGQPGKGSWISNVIGWPLFSVDEDDEESDDADDDDGDGPPAEARPGRSGWSARHFEGVSNAPLERIPPPAADEGGWKDAAWLLSVASKVVF